MIARIKGHIVEKKENAVVVDVSGIFYEVFVPTSVLQRLDAAKGGDGMVTLITHHYLQVGPSSAVPIMVGFLNEVEKDFFLQFISVSGIGPKAAVRALNRSIAEIASAIDKGDGSFLKTLPGIGQQKARDIIAKLQGKVGRFGLIRDEAVAHATSVPEAFEEEALAVLMQLQYKKAEAEAMVGKALERNPAICTAEELLNAIYAGTRKP
ncbi:MAG: Holliday junction DNA helicase RuvA [Candidatus Omnitrophica bacterium]|nr:Holliday junction DNA helicase RuvA [Candidatus Omnitrophota bacterium]